MKIGIIEICEPNHYTAVEALAETYACDSSNEIFLFVTPLIADLLQSLNRHKAVRLVVQQADEDTLSFLKRILAYPLDRLHINTVSRDYGAFADVDWQGAVYLSVHNTEQWFDNGLRNRFGLFRHQLAEAWREKRFGKIWQKTVLFAKDFGRQRDRERLLRKLMRIDYKMLVYSEAHQAYISRFVPEARVLVFPFALHTHLPDRSSANKRLRICIPGTVSSARRDYDGFFRLLEKSASNWTEKITVDLLGYIPKDEVNIRTRIGHLRKIGFDLLAYDNFIDTSRYDALLSQADLILGNLKVQLNPYQRYGSTKETGVIFNIIKSGKPALLPGDYPVDRDLAAAVRFFGDYTELQKAVSQFLSDRSLLESMKHQAKKAVLAYTPENLLNRLKS
ncbi:MAG: hypothetical protein MUD08_11155 [Cytophagales bacterium]|jgi:hypothetical protein|nr:hypothetical protein [Cytophagales bacterium]